MVRSSLASGHQPEPLDDDYVAPPLYATPRTLTRKTYGGEVQSIAASLGRPYMPHQQQIVDVGLEVNPETGELAYGVVIVVLPRQGGKTELEMGVAVHRSLAFSAITGTPQKSVYTAQTFFDARQKWLEQVEFLESFPRIARQIRTKTGNTDPLLTWPNGAKYFPLSVTKKSGHSKSLDLVMLDEAWAHEDSTVENGLVATMATRQQPQLWIFSRGPARTSHYLKSKMKLGRHLTMSEDGGVNSGIAYLEWGADRDDPDFDRADPRTWAKAHPAVPRLISVSFLRQQQLSMDADPDKGPEYWDVNFLNLEPLEDGQAWSLINQQRWKAGEDYVDDDNSSTIAQHAYLSADLSPDRAWGAIAVAGYRADGNLHGEVLEFAQGPWWIPDELARYAAELGLKKVYLDASGAIGNLIPDIQALGLEVILIGTNDRIAADSGLVDDINAHRFFHLGQAELTAAARGATKRPMRMGKAWAFGWGTAPLAPLIAVSNARWAAHTQPPEKSNDQLMKGVH